MSHRRPDRIRLVSKRLKLCREAAGYESARAFYDCAGGLADLRCSYATYRRLEETARLPKPRTFEIIYEELERFCEPKPLQALARAYAQAVLGEEMSTWPQEGGARRGRRLAGLPETPAGVWNELSDDPLKLAAVVALESGRASAADLPGPALQARRALERLARAGLARRRGRGFVPISRAFPIARAWAPTPRERDAFLRRLFSASGGCGEIVGGATTFVNSDRNDMEEFFRLLWGSTSRQVRRARAAAARGEPVYLLEIRVQERIPARGDD